MAMAASEILKQAEQLSADEQVELATKLMEQARQIAKALPRNGHQREVPAAEPGQSGVEEGASDENETEEGLDVFSLNHVPPKWTYMAQARFYYVGRGKPTPYDLSDVFNDEEEDTEE